MQMLTPAHVEIAKTRIAKVAREVVTVLDYACLHAAMNLEHEAEAYPRHIPDDEQVFPNLVRLHSLRRLRSLERSFHSDANRIILDRPFNLSIGVELYAAPLRFYKFAKNKRIRPGSATMVRFMGQERFWEQCAQGKLVFEPEEEPKLLCPNIAAYWEHHDFRLQSVTFLVPEGFTDDGDLSRRWEAEYRLEDFVKSAPSDVLEDEEQLVEFGEQEVRNEGDPREVDEPTSVIDPQDGVRCRAEEAARRAADAPEEAPLLEGDQPADLDRLKKKGKGNK